MVPIVLTATIVPNSIKTSESDWRLRRVEYLEAISFYRRFSKVYFLENSRYDLMSDPAFADDEDCCHVKLPLCTHPEKGKGYQEFQMLDEFVAKDLIKDCFIKVTGRYIYENFGRLFSFVLGQGQRYDVIIDALRTRKLALTSLFYTHKKTYIDHFQGSYHYMSDSTNIWAEHMMYRLLEDVDTVTFFPVTPVLSSALTSAVPKQSKVCAKNLQRRLFSAFSARQLLR